MSIGFHHFEQTVGELFVHQRTKPPTPKHQSTNAPTHQSTEPQSQPGSNRQHRSWLKLLQASWGVQLGHPICSRPRIMGILNAQVVLPARIAIDLNQDDDTDQAVGNYGEIAGRFQQGSGFSFSEPPFHRL